MITTIATLTDGQREELESILVSDERRLLRLIGTADTGRGDVMYGPAAAEAESAQRLDLEVRLDTVRDALQRLREGRYGTCVRCGTSIPYGRLMVMPESQHCVNCGA